MSEEQKLPHLTEDPISYEHIGKAQSYYRALGYRNLAAPWLVSPLAIQPTLPEGARMFPTPAGVLVGSAEQSFIELMQNGVMPVGRFQATTPCFRSENEYNELTRLYFVKTELIWYMPEDVNLGLDTLLNHAFSCFFELSDVDTFEQVQTAEGFDIYFNGIELGSYGVRKMKEHLWVYGTGLAEPRFSIAMRNLHRTATIISMADTAPTDVSQTSEA